VTFNVVTIPNGKIPDFIDYKIRNDTPEEYVRQSVERRLVLELGYRRDQIAVEFPITMGSQRKRVDLAVFREGTDHIQDNIIMIVECKQDSQDPLANRDGVEQQKSYLSACPNAEWGMWSNSKYKTVYRRVIQDRRTTWEEPNDIPPKGWKGRGPR
jgi:type I restriction enzyme M protein